jgi:hypothetical protein
MSARSVHYRGDALTKAPSLHFYCEINHLKTLDKPGGTILCISARRDNTQFSPAKSYMVGLR